MSSKKKKILFRLIVLSVLMCVVLPLSVHAALVIGNEFGYGTYVGYWKSQADTVSPPGYLMDFMQYGGQPVFLQHFPQARYFLETSP